MSPSFASPSTDGKHFARIGDALTVAPAGATIAVDAGEYRESVTIGKNVNLVGRCAEKVVLSNPSGTNPGVYVTGSQSAEVRGITVRDQLIGAAVDRGSQLRLQDCVLDENREIGLLIVEKGGMTLSGIVVRNTRLDAQGAFGVGAYVDAGCSFKAERSAFAGNRHSALLMVDETGSQAETHAVLRRSIIAHTTSIDYDGTLGQGIFWDAAGTLELTECVVAANQSAGVLARHPRARLAISRTVVRDTRPDDNDLYGYGIVLLRGTQADVTESALVANTGAGLGVDSEFATTTSTARMTSSVVRATVTNTRFPNGFGVVVQNQGRVELTQSALVANTTANLLVRDQSTLVASRSLLRDTNPTQVGGFGRGASLQSGSRAEITSCAFVGNRDAGLMVLDAGTAARVADSVVLDTREQAAGRPFGEGIIVRREASLDLVASVIQRSAGIGIAVAGAGARIVSSFVADNPVGLHVQDGTSLLELEEVPATIRPLECAVSSDTRFDRNGLRTSADAIPLPGDIE